MTDVVSSGLKGKIRLTVSLEVRALIQSRINNANNPMPPSGLMSIDERAIVDIWVSGGAPQN